LIIAIALATGRAFAPLPQDVGAAGTYQKLLKLRTIASVMHTTAHPTMSTEDCWPGWLAASARACRC
jgi:hypothetical protein